MIKAMRPLVMFVLAILVIVDVALSARAVVDSTTGLVVAVANDDDGEQQLRQQPTSETRPPTTTLATIGPSEPPSQFVYLTSSSSYSGPTVVATPSMTAEANATTAEAADEQRQQTTTTTTMTHRLGPTDDTYIEIYRPNTPLGDRTKLKLDAIDTDEEEWDDGKDETRRKRRNGRMPTKVILIKFDINRVMKRLPVANDNDGSNHRTPLRVINGNEEEVTTTTTLVRVTLNMYALTESKFGGYVTRLRTNLHRDDDDNNNDDNDWDEESTTWRDVVQNGDNNNERDDVENRAKRLLPDDDKPRGKWILASSSSQSRNNNNTTTTNEGEEEWIRLPKNPEIGRFNTVTANEWSSIDITDTIYQLPLMSDDDNLAVVHLDNNNTSSSSRSSTSDDDDSRVLSLMITTDIVDGVIYASKEDWSSNGPYLEFTFTTTTTTTVMTTTDSSTPTTMTVNSSLITSSVMTPVIIGNNHKEATALTEIVNTTTTTSVISSSFRMTLIAIETRDNAIPGSSSTSRNNTVDVVPSLEEKEGSSIIEHLLRVYREVLSIPPMDISLAFEEELVVEDVVLGDESSSSSGVIRKCVFRVMGK